MVRINAKNTSVVINKLRGPLLAFRPSRRSAGGPEYLRSYGAVRMDALVRLSDSVIVREPGLVIRERPPIFVPESLIRDVEVGFRWAADEETGPLSPEVRRSVEFELAEYLDLIYSKRFSDSLDEC